MNVVNIVPMSSPPPPPRRSEPHTTVLGREVVDRVAVAGGGSFVDVTLGAGGHAELLLETAPGASVIGLDRDPTALAIAGRRLGRHGARVRLAQAAFSELEARLEALGEPQVDGLIADLGTSSMQLDDPERGMSFRSAGPLDMRMDPTTGETALELIERLDDDELADVLFQYGEERRSRRVARCIKQAAEAGELGTTLDLRRAVVRAVGPARIGGVDPATRTFQALRIAVNRELEEIEALLAAAPRVVRPGGVVAIISFHSLEDRLVKHAFRDASVWEPLTKKPIVASDEEVEGNPRARSAKLRVARRLAPGATFRGLRAVRDEERGG